MERISFCFTLVALLLFVLIAKSTETCWDKSNKNVEMTQDSDIEVGSPIILNCTLLDESIKISGKTYYVNSSQIFFAKKNSTLENAEIITLTPLTSQLRINISRIEDSGMYRCNVNLSDSEKDVVLCGSTISVGTKPTPVEDFSCKSIYYERLKCIWRIKTNFIDTLSKLFYLRFAEFGMNSPIICPDIRKENSTHWSCEWTRISTPVYDRVIKKYLFVVTTKNSLGSRNDTFWVDHNKIVLPSKPQKLKYHNLSSTGLLLEWSFPKDMDDFKQNLLYQLVFYKLNENLNENPKVINITSKEEIISYNITNLLPNTQYKFDVRCRSKFSEGEDMWSENTTKIIYTKEDVPTILPEITNESFEVQQSGNNYTIILRWKDVPKEFRNGRNFFYMVNCVSTDTLNDEKDIILFNETMTSSSPFITFSNLDSSSGYKFKIYSANNMGISEKYRSITVNKSSNLLQAPKDITVISYGQDNYNISWKPVYTTDNSIKGYTIFWCANVLPRPYPCDGSIHWKRVPANITSIELQIPNLQTNIQFAMATYSEYSSSGMEWVPCNIPFNNTIVKIREPFSLTAKNSSAIHIAWSFDCNAQKALIKEFIIIYCQAKDKKSGCIDKRHSQTLLNNSAEDYYIGGLTSKALYRVFIRIITINGKEVDSIHQFVQTLSEGITSEMIISIIIGVSLTCIILTFIICYLVKWMKKKFDLVRKLKIRLPTGLDMPNRENLGTYENFKKGLFQQNTSLPPLKPRPGSFVLDSNKNRYVSQLSNSSAEELLYKNSGRCDTYWRNPSGDSSSGCSSNGFHDSISSSNTNHTHLSTDSGAELDISSVNTTDNVFYDPSLILKSNIRLRSKVNMQMDDKNNNFGLVKEVCVENGIKTEIEPSISDINIILPLNDNQLKQYPYSKFGLNGTNSHYSKQWNNILSINYNLCNSEPSIVNINENSSNQNESSALISYSKIGISKSSENIDHYSKNTQGYYRNEKAIEDANKNETSKISTYITSNLPHKNNYDINILKPYISMGSYFENILKVSNCKEDITSNSKDNDENMAYSKFDIQPSIEMLSNQMNSYTSQIGSYIPIHQAHSMPQGVILPEINLRSSFDINIFNFNNNDLLPEKLSLSEVNLAGEVLNTDENFYSSIEPIEHESACTYGCEKSFDIDDKEINLKSEDSQRKCKPDVTKNETSSLEDCHTEEPYRKINYVSGNDIVPEEENFEVIMSPQQLDCASTYVSPYRFDNQSDNIKATDNKNGYVHLPTVYYV